VSEGARFGAVQAITQMGEGPIGLLEKIRSVNFGDGGLSPYNGIAASPRDKSDEHDDHGFAEPT